MSIRIYALAKELKVDNKVLMDTCAEIGVPIKGSSALASLAEEDVEKIRHYLNESAAKKPAADARGYSFLAPEPPKQVFGKIPTLTTARPKKSQESALEEESVVSPEPESVSQPEISPPVHERETAAVEPVSPEVEVPREEKKVPEAKIPEKPVEKVPKSAEKVPKSAEKVPESVPETRKEKVGTVEKAPHAGGEKKPKDRGVGGTSAGPSGRESDASRGAKTPPPGGKGPVKGSSPRSTPLGTRLSGQRGAGKGEGSSPREFGTRQTITQKIASQAELDAPVRPNLKPAEMGNFPTLQTARTIRRDEDGGARGGKGRADAGKSQTSIRLAPLPTTKQPQRKTKEPEAQQPVIRLSPEMLSGKQAVDTKSFVEKVEKEERSKWEERGKGEKAGTGRGEKGRPADRVGTATDRKRRGPEVPRAPLPVPEAESASSKLGKKGVKPKTTGKHGEAGSVLDRAGDASRDSRLIRQRRSRLYDQRGDEDEGGGARWRKQKKVGASTAAPRKNNVILHLPLTVRSFAEELGLQAAKVLGKLLMMGTAATINDPLDEATAQLLAESFGVPVDIRPEISLEEKLIGEFENLQEEDESLLVPRPPVVTFLGHVDHGKTSLLDKIIGINVVSGEKGGITQHIRAYNVKRNDRSITFVDTPGHEAFTEMRARGANCTDIAVIVVAADDGVMPQTEEAISHARAAGVPIIVALNKIDLPGINEPKILQELATNNLLPAEWGGDVEVVRCSALTGQGIDDLLDMMLTIAELQEFKANPQKPATGVCLEASLQAGHGVVAKLLVRNGTLRDGDVLVCGTTCGRVKVMFDTLKTHKKHHEAGPAIPVNVVGLDAAPGAGDKFYVVPDIADARRLADLRAQEARQLSLAGTAKQHTTLEGLFDKLGSTEVKMLNVILRADVRGSIEAIKKEMEKLHHEEVQIHILQATVGGITEADVQLADAADAIIVGFNVVPDENARVLAEQKGVQVRRYDIIYQLTADIKAALEGMLKPEEREKVLGRALVQKTFSISRVGTVAGCRVLSGTVVRDSKIRIIRDNRIIGVYPLDTLKRERDDAKEVREGYECGMKLAGFNDIKEGDLLEAYQIESVARTF